ncbi:hypothetical protein JOD31_001863 [Methylopila capsulata]|uniref:Uncharacterized protein n=1 Tax=Methylopila capsulata TaxID=61654 RepID=A0A9W6IR86_9HYPH|nr:hypothetical protein [Methylopila capsulata]MBM7851638.1 hypothetical protein [Methylopila capsulata]GLK54698.1 hypothetical protein GCM10008170_07170 [Methylopila capsulata]
MFSATSCALTGRSLRSTAPSATERALARFPSPQGCSIRRLARRDPRLADLALSFPGLLATLAAPKGSFDPEPAIAAIERGAALKLAAALAAVPMWTRRLPPEAFAAADLRRLPDGDRFRRQIANAVPKRPAGAARWLQMVSEAALWGDDAFVLWTAREAPSLRSRRGSAVVRPLALYAFYSRNPATSAGAIVDRLWSPKLGAPAALEGAEAWLIAAELRAHMAAPTSSCGLKPGRILDADLVPLLSESDVVEEAIAMRNCLRRFGPQVRRQGQSLWSLRRGERRVATLRIGYPRGSPILGVLEFRGPNNADVDLELWAAVHRWLGAHNLASIRPEIVGWRPEVIDRTIWAELWRPYWLALGRFPAWLPLRPSSAALEGLKDEIRWR